MFFQSTLKLLEVLKKAKVNKNKAITLEVQITID